MKRFRIFKHSLMVVEGSNGTMGINEMSDWTEEEIASIQDGKDFKEHNMDKLEEIDKEIPVFEGHGPIVMAPSIQKEFKYDWRHHKGVIPGVKYQGKCGSCWAFGATGVIESNYAIRTGKSVDLSIQQILDCTNGIFNLYFSSRCDGGFDAEAYRFARGSFLAANSIYPYNGKDQPCK